MKREIVVFLYALTVMHVSGADYLSRSFRWDVNLSVEDGIQTTSTITIGKDTTINSTTYRLVDNYHPMRQVSDSILWYDRIAKKEILLYNFALQEGDSIELMEDSFGGVPTRYAKVTKTEIITLADGRQARKIEYEQKYPAPRSADIEFVGNSEGGILGPLSNSMCEYSLIAFYENDQIVYPHDILAFAQASTWYGVRYFYDYLWKDYTPLITNLTYSLEGDTLINDRQYRQIRYTHEYEHKINAYRGAIRQSKDRQQVYYIPWGSNKEYLLYDFNVKQGDTVYAYDGFNDISCEERVEPDSDKSITPAWIVMKVQTMDGRKHISVQNKEYGGTIEWIEGIGTHYILWPVGRTCYATGMEVQFQHTLCATDSEGNILYSYDTDYLGIHNDCPNWHPMTIENTTFITPHTSKILRDGQLLIERGDKTYTLTGQEVK